VAVGRARSTPGSGFFIALEGGEGAGKSTQARALAAWIRARGYEVVLTCEPGATEIGRRLRTLLLDPASAGLCARAEALLYAADRAQHVETVIRPALARGAVVLSDRYLDSSIAYQGAGRKLAPEEIASLSRWATGGLLPDLTVLLDIVPSLGLARVPGAPDRLESEPGEFHERVRQGFLTLATHAPERYLIVDATDAPESITATVRRRLESALPPLDVDVAVEGVRSQ
jgi:dTMP kinase